MSQNVDEKDELRHLEKNNGVKTATVAPKFLLNSGSSFNDQVVARVDAIKTDHISGEHSSGCDDDPIVYLDGKSCLDKTKQIIGNISSASSVSANGVDIGANANGNTIGVSVGGIKVASSFSNSPNAELGMCTTKKIIWKHSHLKKKTNIGTLNL